MLDAFTDNFMKAGNLAGGFAHYRAAHAGRVKMMQGEAPRLPPIDVETCVRWAEHDPLFPYAWTDRMGETFSKLDLKMFRRRRAFPASRGSGAGGGGDRGVFSQGWGGVVDDQRVLAFTIAREPWPPCGGLRWLQSRARYIHAMLREEGYETART